MSLNTITLNVIVENFVQVSVNYEPTRNFLQLVTFLISENFSMKKFLKMVNNQWREFRRGCIYTTS